MSKRIATIVKATGMVSNISLMESEPVNYDDTQFDKVEVPEHVKIGMVRSGDGFDWPNEDAKTRAENRSEPGATQATDASPGGDGGKVADVKEPSKAHEENLKGLAATGKQAGEGAADNSKAAKKGVEKPKSEAKPAGNGETSTGNAASGSKPAASEPPKTEAEAIARAKSEGASDENAEKVAREKWPGVFPKETEQTE